jgi:AcrR family transcriptional regulator
MKIRSPYWWFKKKRDMTTAVFSDYVRRRHALATATVKGSKLSSAVPTRDPTGSEALEWIYGLLTALDTKASALMRLNGVMLAAAALLLNPLYVQDPQVCFVAIMRFLVALSALGSTISIACCLLVVSVDWPFLGLVIEKNDPIAGNEFDFSEEFFHLQRVAILRQKFYRFGWLLSLVGTVTFLGGIVIFFLRLLNILA